MLNSVTKLRSFVDDWFKKLEDAPTDTVLSLAKILMESKLNQFEQEADSEVRNRCKYAYECGKLGKSYNYDAAHNENQKILGSKEVSSECIFFGTGAN